MSRGDRDRRSSRRQCGAAVMQPSGRIRRPRRRASLPRCLRFLPAVECRRRSAKQGLDRGGRGRRRSSRSSSSSRARRQRRSTRGVRRARRAARPGSCPARGPQTPSIRRPPTLPEGRVRAPRSRPRSRRGPPGKACAPDPSRRPAHPTPERARRTRSFRRPRCPRSRSAALQVARATSSFAISSAASGRASASIALDSSASLRGSSSSERISSGARPISLCETTMAPPPRSK